MSSAFGEFNNWSPLRTVLVRRPADSFVNDAKIDAEWRDLEFPRAT